MSNTDKIELSSEFKALLESVNEYVALIGRNHTLIEVNSLFERDFNGKPGELCYKAWKNRKNKCEECIVERAFQDGNQHVNEEVVIMKDGRIIHIRATATPIRDKSGNIRYVLESAIDITEREKLKRELHLLSENIEDYVSERMSALQQSEERYRMIFENSGEGILLFDPDGILREINGAGFELLGFKSKKEIVGTLKVMDIFKDLEELINFQRMLFNNGSVKDFETSFITNNKKRKLYVNITARVIKDVAGRVSGYVIIMKDITRRKEFTERLSIQNQRLNALITISTAISSSLDLDRVLDITTDKIKELIGSDCVRIYLFDRQRELLILSAYKGLSDRFVEQSHVKSRRLGDGFLGRVIQTGNIQIVDNMSPSNDKYTSYLIKEGFRSTAYIPLMAKGEAVGVMVVSSRKMFQFPEDYLDFLSSIGNQIGIAVHNAELHERVKKAYEELQSAQEQIIRSEKMVSLGKMSASIAHEINNPLAAVLTYVKLIMRLKEKGKIQADEQSNISKYLNIMEAELSKCGDIVKNLLSFSRQSAGEVKEHQVEEIIDRSLAIINHELELKGIRLRKEIEPDIPPVKCDIRHIQQAVLNLLINANEAMDSGGTITIRAENSSKKGFINILVEDTGCGIPKENLDKIFEPFFTTKDDGKGVGLGLSVAYAIIMRHGGSIDVQSTEGKGTRFIISLPIA